MCEVAAVNFSLPVLGTRSLPGAHPPEKHLGRLRTFLELFYSRAGLSLPRLQKIGSEAMPQPYRKLLVHSTDLTPTLEGFFGETVALTVLSRWGEGDRYMREVVLHLAGSGIKVAYGAIHIKLAHLPPASAAVVLQEHKPFGSILRHDGIPHLSWPQAFFRAEPDTHMKCVLGLEHSASLYGRRNVLLNGSRRLLAEVVEVLAPVTRNHHHGGPADRQTGGNNERSEQNEARKL